ncbi:unnamed protein product [Rhodiola kirilowii]
MISFSIHHSPTRDDSRPADHCSYRCCGPSVIVG